MSPWLSDFFLSSQSDERLVTLARAGHGRAFTAIVERYRRPLVGFARQLVADGSAEDVVQQTFLNAFAALTSGAEVKHLRGWLYRILRNTVTANSGRSPVETELDGSLASRESVEEVAEVRMLAQDALGEVASLPERQRAAFIASAIHGQSRTEVANTMALSEGAVRQLVHRARATLRAAASAFIPFPLARWLAGVRSGPSADGVPEVVVGAGTASAGGIALKLGALIASGAVATGVVASRQAHNHPLRPHRGGMPLAAGAGLPTAQLAAGAEAVPTTAAGSAVASTRLTPSTPSAGGAALGAQANIGQSRTPGGASLSIQTPLANGGGGGPTGGGGGGPTGGGGTTGGGGGGTTGDGGGGTTGSGDGGGGTTTTGDGGGGTTTTGGDGGGGGTTTTTGDGGGGTTTTTGGGGTDGGGTTTTTGSH